MLKRIILAVIIIMLCTQANALSVKKEASENIHLGDILNVTIYLTNDESNNINVYVKDTIINAEPVEPSQFENVEESNIIAKMPPHFSWIIELAPKEEKEIHYKIKPNTIGDFYLYPAEALIDGDQRVYYSNSLTVKVKSQNNICEPDKGENYFTDPIDCPSGSADGVCDLIRDSRCDPDCTAGADLDCFCGDNICEKFETSTTCSVDCLCGNGICDSNENDSTCPMDCKKTESEQAPQSYSYPNCNYNNVCEFDESYSTCPSDCPSDQVDYLGLAKPNNYVVYILGFLIISGLTASSVVFLVFQNKKNKDPILTWIKKVRSMGLSDETIKDSLIKRGHKEENISKYFK